MSDSISPEQRQLVDECKAKMLEHFDSVLILVTKHNGGDATTQSYETGGGNFYAQLGQATEWLAIQDQYQRNHAIRKDNEDN